MYCWGQGPLVWGLIVNLWGHWKLFFGVRGLFKNRGQGLICWGFGAASFCGGQGSRQILGAGLLDCGMEVAKKLDVEISNVYFAGQSNLWLLFNDMPM